MTGRLSEQCTSFGPHGPDVCLGRRLGGVGVGRYDRGVMQPLTSISLLSRRRFLLVTGGAAFIAACGGDDGKTVRQPRDPGGDVVIRRTTPTSRGTPPPTPNPTQLCLVTKQSAVPASYVPADLVTLPAEISVRPGERMRREAADALARLIAGARADGLFLLALSGYRSYEQQQAILEQEIRTYGEAKARQQVAEPGHSEHQLGVAVDVSAASNPYDLEDTFGEEPEGKWVAVNAPRFGYVVSYPAGKQPITGYTYEPWHIRYVGIELAQQVSASGKTLTEYLPTRGMQGCPPTT